MAKRLELKSWSKLDTPHIANYIKIALKIDCFITTALKERRIDRIHALKKMIRVTFSACPANSVSCPL
jgi:hypothetical protein